MLDFERLTPAVERTARIVKSSFPAHHDISDIKQELWVWILENKNTVSSILNKSEGADTALVELLRKAANEFLKKEDAASYGYSEGDQFYYSLGLIKSILEVIFKHEDWQSFASAITDMPKRKSDPSKTGNNLASYADVKSAVEKLPEDQYNVIVWRYKYRETLDQVGQHLGITKQGAARRHDAALSAIQKLLGQRDLGSLREGYSERTEARTTASSIARTERDYEG